MYHRLTTLDVAAVERALAAGLRHAEIAREFNLSLWTIAKIADRRRYLLAEPHDEEEARQSEIAYYDDLPEDDGPADYEAQNLHRCPTCGAMIYITPCLACRMATAVPATIPPSGPLAPRVDKAIIKTKRSKPTKKAAIALPHLKEATNDTNRTNKTSSKERLGTCHPWQKTA